jgi:tripartite-type tricarboxylate transporter receptor subunit TctC
MSRLHVVRRCAVVVLLAGSLTSFAQGYPAKPIRLIVPYAPAGGTDISARIVAQKMSEELRQQIIVENRVGAGGIVGTEAASKSPGDGYTLLLVSATTLCIVPFLFSNLPYDPVNSFVPVSLITKNPFVVVVNAQTPVQSGKELVALAKTKPGKLAFGSGGNGNMLHILGEMFKMQFGVDLMHVPYQGAGQAVIDLLGDRIQVMFDVYSTYQSYVASSKVRVLAVTSPTRFELLPDVPSATESGIPGYEAYSWFGYVAPKGTPGEFVARLNAEMQKALATKEVRDTLAKQGLGPFGSTPQEFVEFIKSDTVKWGQVIKAAAIKIN